MPNRSPLKDDQHWQRIDEITSVVSCIGMMLLMNVVLAVILHRVSGRWAVE